MRYRFAALLLAVFLETAAYAQNPTGFGVYNCKDLLLDQGQRVAAQNWSIGYLSGMNLVWARYAPEHIPKNPLGKVNSPQEIYAWLDAYCIRNAQATLAPVLQMYFVELTGLKK